MISASPGITILAKQAGANDSIEKPFMLNDLLAKVGRWIDLSN